MARSQSQIIDYFQEYIFGFIFRDIERCVEAKANYVVALALLSYTEYIGGLITGKLGLKKESAENFNTALEYFEFNGDKNYYKDFKVKYTDENGKKSEADIYKMFRCGLVHEYFVKGDSFIHNNPSGLVEPEDAGIGWIGDAGQRRLRFHTNAYFRDFKNAVMKLYKLLIVDREPNLLKNFNKALDRLENRKIAEVNKR